jgi:hypothetical protein
LVTLLASRLIGFGISNDERSSYPEMSFLMNIPSPFLQMSHAWTSQTLTLMTPSFQRVLLKWEMHRISLICLSQLPTLLSIPLLEIWIKSLMLLSTLHLLRIYQSFSIMAMILKILLFLHLLHQPNHLILLDLM